MASEARAVIQKVTTNGPYSYVVYSKDINTGLQTGIKAVTAIASISAALDGVKADLGALIPAGETAANVTVHMTTA